MTPYYQDDAVTLYGGDCRAVLAELPAESVHCVVTSPPYWGLRDYGTATWEGGDESCDHLEKRGTTRGGPHSTITGGQDTTAHAGNYRETCGKCGATRIDSQLGLEPTPEAYVANMVAVFREVRRVLRDDGTLWLNIGDSYAGSGMTGGTKSKEGSAKRTERMFHGNRRDTVPGLAQKQLIGIPWRVAFALQADGWYLRSDIIWSKPNPMPESVTDRPTKAHEYLFLLAKSPRYYFDPDAVREHAEHREWRDDRSNAITAYPGSPNRYSDGPSGYPTPTAGRNIRSVWTIATEPYPGAHFATFPRKLVEPCVKAGCPEGGTVLDPFAGSGTTLLVAQSLGRRGVGIDLSPEYLRQALVRASRHFGKAAITEDTSPPTDGLWEKQA